MMEIKFVGKTGDPMGELLKEVEEDNKAIRAQVDALGKETETHMRATIAAGKVRPQAGQPTALENAIELETFSNGWGVGDIEKLKKDAPWWAAINFGSMHLVGKHLPSGVFDPGEPKPNVGFFRKGRWSKGANYNGEKYSPLITKPIPAMNYIEKTVFWLSSKFDSLKG